MADKYYILGDSMFSTKQAIKDYYRGILNRYECGQTVNKKHSIELFHLLRNHPHFTEKRGSGIKFFRVETAVQLDVKFHQHKCFWIHRTDGTKIDFSIHECYKYKNQIEKVEI